MMIIMILPPMETYLFILILVGIISFSVLTLIFIKKQQWALLELRKDKPDEPQSTPLPHLACSDWPRVARSNRDDTSSPPQLLRDGPETTELDVFQYQVHGPGWDNPPSPTATGGEPVETSLEPPRPCPTALLRNRKASPQNV